MRGYKKGCIEKARKERRGGGSRGRERWRSSMKLWYGGNGMGIPYVSMPSFCVRRATQAAVAREALDVKAHGDDTVADDSCSEYDGYDVDSDCMCDEWAGWDSEEELVEAEGETANPTVVEIGPHRGPGSCEEECEQPSPSP